MFAIVANEMYRKEFSYLNKLGIFNLEIKDYIKVMKLHHVAVRRTYHNSKGQLLTSREYVEM